MSKKNAPQKRVVKTTRVSSASKRTSRVSKSSPPKAELTFGRQTYIWMGIGVALIVIGMILMSGGAMPSPDVWDEDIIYGFRRTVLAPIFILAGLGVEIYAVLKK